MQKNVLSRFARHVRQTVQRRRMREIFTRVYLTNAWKDAESRSGPGSNREQTDNLKRVLPEMLKRFGVRTLLDIPCGDFAWMREADLSLDRYIGADIVQPVIERNQETYGGPRRSFVCLDLTRDALPADVDMVFCRDCLVHLPLKDVALALRNIKRSGARYVALTQFEGFPQNDDIVAPGKWRKLNLLAEPFCLPQPLDVIDEKSPAAPDKRIAIWRTADLPDDYRI